MSPHVLITGPPRCGTGYIARILADSGLSAGHERWWTLRRDGQTTVDIDVSWLGAFDAGFGGKVFAQTRSPLHAVPSIAANYDLHPWRLVLAQNVTLTGDPIADACRIWRDYALRAVERAEHWWRVEDVTADDLAWTGVDCGPALTEAPHDVNARTGQKPIGADLTHAVLELARDLGYDL